jgi:hypothetical protein
MIKGTKIPATISGRGVTCNGFALETLRRGRGRGSWTLRRVRLWFSVGGARQESHCPQGSACIVQFMGVFRDG